MGINTFKGAVQDLARANRFRVEGAGFGADLPIFCKAASLPAGTIGIMEVPYMGRALKYAGDRTYDEWEITVFGDARGLLRNNFENWMLDAMSHESNEGADLAAYTRDIQIFQLDRQDNPIIEYSMKGAWVSGMAAMDLAWDSNDTPSEFGVTLSFDEYTVG
jgi:hypothetical protein